VGRALENGDNDLNVVYDMDNVNPRFALRHTSLGGCEAVLKWFATQGNNLNRIRAFSRANDPLPEKQAFISAVQEKMAELDKALATVEARFVGPGRFLLRYIISCPCSFV
jgi:hypothetical protein